MFDWLAHIPLWLLGLLLLVLLLAAAFLGDAQRRRQERRDPDFAASRGDSQEGYVVSAVLTLLGLLVGFTLALAIDRYEARRMLVVEDANAIGRLYLQAQLLDEPHRSRLGNILVRYADNHIRVAESDGALAAQLLAKDRQLLDDLWAGTGPAFQTIRGIDFSSTFVDSVNGVIELAAARLAARTAQIPPAVFAVLFLYTIVSAAVLGYVLTGRRGRVAGGALLALFTMLLMLLSDINRPVTGTIRESQDPMKRMRASLPQVPPAWPAEPRAAVSVSETGR